MDKMITRFTVMIVAAYFIMSYVFAQFMGTDILRDTYMLLFELCVVSYTFSGGKYHCRYIRWTALSILVCDIISHLDYHFDIFGVTAYNYICFAMMCAGVIIPFVMSVNHILKVKRIKRYIKRYGKKI